MSAFNRYHKCNQQIHSGVFLGSGVAAASSLQNHLPFLLGTEQLKRFLSLKLHKSDFFANDSSHPCPLWRAAAPLLLAISRQQKDLVPRLLWEDLFVWRRKLGSHIKGSTAGEHLSSVFRKKRTSSNWDLILPLITYPIGCDLYYYHFQTSIVCLCLSEPVEKNRFCWSVIWPGYP